MTIEPLSNRPAKIRLAISIITFVIVIALLVVGIVLYFTIKKNEDNIMIEGNDVNITASATISGMQNNPVLEDIVINAENVTGKDSWQNLSLIFNGADDIVITITIRNNHSVNGVDVLFSNLTTGVIGRTDADDTANLTLQEHYYMNGDTTGHEEVTSQPVRLAAQESCTLVITFGIFDINKSVNSTLNIDIVCNNVDVEA